jgi:Asp-tRNA(Asn)/Glu-tRNA(Gln) amidotransferase C subunit
MKDAVRRLNEEYHFELTDKEVDIVVRQAEDAALLFKPLFEVNVDGVTPLTIVDKRVRQISAPKKGKK